MSEERLQSWEVLAEEATWKEEIIALWRCSKIRGKLVKLPGKTVTWFLQKLYTELPCDPATLLLGLSLSMNWTQALKSMHGHVHKSTVPTS